MYLFNIIYQYNGYTLYLQPATIFFLSIKRVLIDFRKNKQLDKYRIQIYFNWGVKAEGFDFGLKIIFPPLVFTQ